MRYALTCEVDVIGSISMVTTPVELVHRYRNDRWSKSTHRYLFHLDAVSFGLYSTRSYIREMAVQQDKRSCLRERYWTCCRGCWAPSLWERSRHSTTTYILQGRDALDWRYAKFQLVLGYNSLDFTYERWSSNGINYVSNKRALVDAEPLRIGKRVVMRRWLISVRSVTHCIGETLVFFEFAGSQVIHARKVRWGVFGMACRAQPRWLLYMSDTRHPHVAWHVDVWSFCSGNVDLM